MISPRFIRLTVAMLVSLGALGASRAAHAQSMTCASDTDCSKGFSCQTVGASACPAIACAPGEECDIPICDPQIIKECEPGPCNTDADCATGMVCFTDSAESCPPPVEVAPSCPKDAPCAEAVNVDVDAGACTTMTSKSCVPKYDLPCHVDSTAAPDSPASPTRRPSARAVARPARRAPQAPRLWPRRRGLPRRFLNLRLVRRRPCRPRRARPRACPARPAVTARRCGAAAPATCRPPFAPAPCWRPTRAAGRPYATPARRPK